MRVKLKTPSPVTRKIREEGEKSLLRNLLCEKSELFFRDQANSKLPDHRVDSFHLGFELVSNCRQERPERLRFTRGCFKQNDSVDSDY